MNQTIVKRDVYQIVTDRIIELLEQGTIPWQQSWTKAGMPQNLVSKKPYRGINVFLLSSLNYMHNFFLTKKQLSNLEGKVKEGEKSHFVVFWKWPEKNTSNVSEEENGKRRPPILRYYTVYNVSQCTGIPEGMITTISTNQNDPIDTCESILDNMPQRPEIKRGGNSAFYHPIHDYVQMPELNAFIDSEHYYSVLFHELIHSTGHDSRLCRKEIIETNTYGTVPYSIEELTAEIGSCYLNSLTGIVSLHRPFENNVAYIQGWLAKLKNDRKFIVYASSQAQRAVDFIMNFLPEPKVETGMEVKHE